MATASGIPAAQPVSSRGVVAQQPDLPLAEYLLAASYVGLDAYGKAIPLFRLLAETFPEQTAFSNARTSLAGLAQAPYYSTDKAKGLLDLSRAFMALRDLPMADRLCRIVLEEMPGRLEKQDRKAAYFELGRIHETRGDLEGAFGLYRQALTIDPHYRAARERIERLMAGRPPAS